MIWSVQNWINVLIQELTKTLHRSKAHMEVHVLSNGIKQQEWMKTQLKTAKEQELPNRIEKTSTGTELKLIQPVDLAQERCLVTIFLTSLTPRALQVHTTDSLSEDLKNTRWRLCGRWRSGAQVSDKNTQKLRENMLCRTVLKAHNPSRMSHNKKTYFCKFC